MIVVRVELWPKGDESRKREIGLGQITNVGSSTARGDYTVKLLKSPEYAKTGGIWRSGWVRDFPRTSGAFGPWDLLLLALLAALGQERVTRLLRLTGGKGGG
ncbi:MAG TPA: hypothetical protein VLC46_16505 [Thermoanaerobaculia bacterium]|jgi:hypothetical protein|nr:hypothetical protein [Thermoanaerobaculia bacterium]